MVFFAPGEVIVLMRISSSRMGEHEERGVAEIIKKTTPSEYKISGKNKNQNEAPLRWTCYRTGSNVKYIVSW